jgi:hypothetical protein
MKKPHAQIGKGRVGSAALKEIEHSFQSTRRNSVRKLRAAQVPAPGSRAAVVAMQRNADRVAYVNAPVEATTPTRRAKLLKLLREVGGHDNDRQRLRVQRAIESGPLTTHEARAFLDVLSPAARVFELRQLGEQIDTVWCWQITGAGNLHRVSTWKHARPQMSGSA